MVTRSFTTVKPRRMELKSLKNITFLTIPCVPVVVPYLLIVMLPKE